MSKDVIYPFANESHIEGKLGGVTIPRTSFMEAVQSVEYSNMVPQKIDSLGRLHLSVFNSSKVYPVTDVVFRIEADTSDTQYADNLVKDFTQAVQRELGQDRHMTVRRLHKDTVTYYMVRFFFNNDFKCTYHPEMRLGEPTRTFMCPVCQTLQITGLPHIEDTSE